MKKIFFIILIVIIGISTYGYIKHNSTNENKTHTMSRKTIHTNKMMLILAAPSIDNKYYQEYFNEIVSFQINYANKIIGNDDIRILVDKETKKYYKGKVPNDILIEEEMYDIWMRDFTTVNPENPIQFVYTNASMTTKESKTTQNIFNTFADSYNIERTYTKYVIDGGNIVDNYDGKAITTTRFLEDNNLEYDEAKIILKELLLVDEVAIIEPDDEVLAHADGMVAWIDDNVLAVNDYSKIDLEFHELVIDELQYSFPNTKIVLVPVVFEEKGVDKTKGIGSACGVNLNLVATYDNLYVPIFHTDYEKEALDIIRNNTSKNIIEIDAQNICLFGGSVRCTTWQLSGKNHGQL